MVKTPAAFKGEVLHIYGRVAYSCRKKKGVAPLRELLYSFFKFMSDNPRGPSWRCCNLNLSSCIVRRIIPKFCQYVRGIGRVIQNLKDYKSQDILVEKGWKMCQNIGPSNYPLWINHQIGDKFLWVIRLTDRRLALHRILSNQWFGIIGWSVIRGWPLRQALPHTTQCAQAFLCPGWQKLRNRSTGEMSKIQPFTF